MRAGLTRVGRPADDVDVRALRLQCLRAQHRPGDLADVCGLGSVGWKLHGLHVGYVPIRYHDSHHNVTETVWKVGPGEGAAQRSRGRVGRGAGVADGASEDDGAAKGEADGLAVVLSPLGLGGTEAIAPNGCAVTL